LELTTGAGDRFIHKHHHRQKAPSRGTADAINVHPFEFVCGEYNHLLAIYLVPYGHAPPTHQI
jgi:sterol desaturase/sphingolipid hydroxylase (fatty acid hydroxylase superfamily)